MAGPMTFQLLIEIVGLIILLGGGFYFTGRVSSTLERLASITADHEDRIRFIERHWKDAQGTPGSPPVT